ncbi:hypothetical protein BDW74DRAFT_174467 [Aspergillus multicolor]|uniref:uncharacterized protein n=1 Tax=Aspergillus multicolor TaxID=41759 RepID=UPI003CCE1356
MDNMEYADLNRYQDILDQLPMLQEVIEAFSAAITKVRQKVPWMGARVVNIGKRSGNSGLARVIAWPAPNPPIVVKDLQDQVPSFSAFVACKAPLSMIDSDLFTPVPGFPQPFHDSDKNPAHTILVQVNFVKGGVVNFSIHHHMADAGGHFGLVQMIAMVMRGEEIPVDLLKDVNADRRTLFPLLGKTSPCSTTAATHIFHFTADKLKQLKALASQKEGFDPAVPYITTDDALCALCWQRLLAVRQQLHPDSMTPSTISCCARSADGRRILGISPNYMGDVIHNIGTEISIAGITDSPLSSVACRLRTRVNESNNDTYHIRSFATLIANEPDKSTITYGGDFNPTVDFATSSIVARSASLFPDFGRTLGKPLFVRRPSTTPFPGVGVFLPTEDGGIDVFFGLVQDEFEVLRKDEAWNRFAEYIG